MWGHGYGGQDDLGGLYFYTYYQDMASIYGDCSRWGNFKFQTNPERWYNITIRMVYEFNQKLTAAEGIRTALWKDSLMENSLPPIQDYRFRNVSSIHIDKMKIYSFFGGSGSIYAAARDEWSMIDNVYLFTYASGVNVPRGRTPSPAGRVLELPNMMGSSPPAISAPAAPSGLSVSSKSSSSVSLRWTDNSGNETGFRLQRSASASSGFTQIATLGAGTTSYTDGGLKSGTTYYYRLQAYNTAGNSAWSNSTSSTTDQPLVVSGDGMVACWTLENNGTDLSGNNHSLSLYNGANYSSDKKQGSYSLFARWYR